LFANDTAEDAATFFLFVLALVACICSLHAACELVQVGREYEMLRSNLRDELE